MRKRALWLGRFQPPTIAHLATLEIILAGWEKVIIGIIYATERPEGVDPRWNRYLQESERATFHQSKNPFSPDEVRVMWEAALEKAGVRDHVEAIAMPRPQYQPNFNVDFSPDHVDYVLTAVSPEDSMSEKQRFQLYQDMFARKLFTVSPPWKLHNSEIRTLVTQGRDWAEFIPPGAIDIFRTIDGPERVRRAIALGHV